MGWWLESHVISLQGPTFKGHLAALVNLQFYGSLFGHFKPKALLDIGTPCFILTFLQMKNACLFQLTFFFGIALPRIPLALPVAAAAVAAAAACQVSCGKEAQGELGQSGATEKNMASLVLFVGW